MNIKKTSAASLGLFVALCCIVCPDLLLSSTSKVLHSVYLSRDGPAIITRAINKVLYGGDFSLFRIVPTSLRTNYLHSAGWVVPVARYSACEIAWHMYP